MKIVVTGLLGNISKLLAIELAEKERYSDHCAECLLRRKHSVHLPIQSE